MERAIYEVRVREISDSGKETVANKEIKKSKGEKESKTNNEVTSSQISKGIKRTIGAIATLYATSNLIINPIMKEKINLAAVTGDIVQAQNLQRKHQNINKAVGLGFEALGIGVAFGINPALGSITIFRSGVKHLSEAVSREQTNKSLRAVNEISNFINNYERARMVGIIK